MSKTKFWLIGAALLIFFSALWGYRKMSRADFKARFMRENAGLDTAGIPLLLLLALAAYESGDGTGNIAQQTNNIFSVTAGKYWKGPVYAPGNGYVFRKYGSWREATADFIKLMVNWPSNYGKALAAGRAGDLNGFAKALQAAGYGDPGKMTYAAELLARAKAYENIA